MQGDARPVAGADGCRRGWVVAVLDGGPGDGGDGGLSGGGDGALVRRGRLTFTVVPRIGPTVAQAAGGRLAACAIDMPIGLPDDGPRACDREARRRLGPRASSVFPCPMRSVLGAATYDEAHARSRLACGKALSWQTFGLVKPIAEVDAAVEPALQDRVVEAHPELAFARLAGHPADHPKRTPEGRRERRDLLAAAGLGDLDGVRLPGAAGDDLLDAAVLTLTAARVRDGTAERVGDGSRDARGLVMEMVF